MAQETRDYQSYESSSRKRVTMLRAGSVQRQRLDIHIQKEDDDDLSLDVAFH